MRFAWYTANLIQLGLVTLLVVWTLQEKGRRVIAVAVIAVLLTLGMTLAGGCAKAAPRTTIVQPCHLTTPPPDVAEQDDIQPLVKWSHDAWHACASMRAEDYPPSPIEEGDDDE